MGLAKIGIKVLGIILAIPFITYGFLGLIRWLGLEATINNYLGVIGGYKNPVTAFILVVIGLCLLYGLNTLANRMR
jgi:uncharacterized membrane protein YphA (DoxX/SURF4 family)